MKKFLRIVLYSLLVLLVIIVILPALLYVPAVQNFACQTAVEYINENNNYADVSIGKIRISYPLKLRILDVKAYSKQNGKLMLSLGKLQTSLDQIPFREKEYFFWNHLELSDYEMHMDSLTESLGINGKFRNLDIQKIRINKDFDSISVHSFILACPDIAIEQRPSEPDSLEEESNLELLLELNKLIVNEGNFSFNDICVNEYAVDANEFMLVNEDISLKNLMFKTPYSNIDASLKLNYKNLDLNTVLEANLAKKDITNAVSAIMPEITDIWPDYNTSVKLTGSYISDTLDVQNFAAQIDKHIDIKIEGFGVHLFKSDSIKINATLNGSLDDADFLLTAFVDKPENRSYCLPKELFAKVEASYSKNKAKAGFVIRQEGEIVAEGNGEYDISAEAYSVNVKTNRLCVNNFVPSIGIDGITSRIEGNGRHFKFPSKYTSFDIKATLDTLYYSNGKAENDSIYNVRANATLNNSHYYAQISSEHPYLMLDTQLEGDYDRDKISAQGYIDLQKLDLLRMPQIVAANVGEISLQSDLMCSYDYGDNAYADILVHSLTYDDGYQVHPFDQIDIQLESETNRMNASFKSGDAIADFVADKSIATFIGLSDSLLTTINKQIAIPMIDVPEIQKHLPNMHLELEMQRNNSFYHIARMFGYDYKQIKSSINNDSVLSVQARVLGLNTAETHIDTIQVRFRPEHNKDIYDYKFHASYTAPKVNDSFILDGKGAIYRDSIVAGIEYENGKYIKMYDVSASLKLDPDEACLRFLTNPIIYAQKLDVNKDNYVRVKNFMDLSTNELAINSNLDLDNETGLCVNLLTNKKDSIAGNEVKLNIENLDLTYLSNTLDLGLDLGGKLNAQLLLDLLPAALSAKVNTDINTFHIGDYSAQQLFFDGNCRYKEGKKLVDGKLTINELVKFNLFANLCDSINVDLYLKDFPLPLVNYFMPENIQLYGEANGDFSLRGKDISTVMANGFVKMHEASVNIADCDATLQFPADTIRVRRNRLRLRDYKLKAANDNPVTLAGTVDFREDFTNPMINMTLNAEKTQLFKNSRRKNKKQYIYGTLPVNVDISMMGNVSNLKVKGNIETLNNTKLTYFLEEDPLNSTSKVDELVEFVRFRELDRIVLENYQRPYMVQDKEEGVTVNLDLNISPSTNVYCILPTNERDHANIKGGGKLRLTMTPDGTLSMNGMYDVTEGDVQFKLPMLPVSKEFEMSNQSWISWNGEIGEPKLNIVAVEKVKSMINDEEGAKMANFNVIITISGTLNAIDLKFDCEIENNGVIASELANLTEEERQKQALLLLIAGTYMGPGSKSNAGLSTANAALNSILNKELESMLTNKLKHTDINVGIDSYEASGSTRTDYSVKVSQMMFNDRMKISVGGKISSGSSDAQGNNDAMINDVSVEYKIKSDGSSIIRVFNQNNYENILEGHIIETGVGYAQHREGFRFRNLFFTNKKRQAALQEHIKQMQEAEREALRQPIRNRRPNSNKTQGNQSNVNDSIQKNDSIQVRVISVPDSITVGM